MTCPVCGLPDASTPCARCGTDLSALAGDKGPVRLEIVSIAGGTRSATRRDPTF